MIKFGTDGWRGLIAKDFTYDNLDLVALATANYIKKNQLKPNKAPSVVIGYDTRFLSKEFATEVALICASQDILVHLTDSFSSTPQVSFHTKQKGADLGIIITASHNPPEYNGFKLKANFGGPATPEQVAKVEEELNGIQNSKKKNILPKLQSLDSYIKAKKIKLFNPKDSYIRVLKKKIDIEAIKASKLRIVLDPMYGAGMNTLKTLLPNIEEIHNYINPSFGDLGHPEPIAENLYALKDKVIDGHFDIGLATDGDADRLGVIDSTGEFINSHFIYMILLKYLYEKKNKRGTVVKTVSLTSMVDDYCKSKGIELIETKVGFKYVAELMANKNKNVLIGGEESGGLGTILHIPERDGLFNALLLLEVMVNRNMSLRELCNELEKEFGQHRYLRRDVIVTPAQKKAILSAAEKCPEKLGKHVVTNISTKDGYKFFVKNGWLLIRASGTEPLIRFYAEADSIGCVIELLDEGIKLAKIKE